MTSLLFSGICDLGAIALVALYLTTPSEPKPPRGCCNRASH
jgi:hypothetical protein